ncbi:hypothetical protein GJR99_09610 [Haloferax sp. MBLA0078]|uniref:Uncharacterized protein n=1 Tax=Haloferax marinum TaxID=2666143 RepID=A0A6A8G6D5_9EURY|nr:hypothetical protein [Haloferax marinum]MRW96830.1 hypothetical protein [Haloferax marinum]
MVDDILLILVQRVEAVLEVSVRAPKRLVLAPKRRHVSYGSVHCIPT